MYSSGTSGEPPDKRRKKDSDVQDLSSRGVKKSPKSERSGSHDAVTDDLWDDDPLDFTNEQFEYIDVLSQTQRVTHEELKPQGNLNVYGERTDHLLPSYATRPVIGATRAAAPTLRHPFSSQRDLQTTKCSKPFGRVVQCKPSVGLQRSKSSEFPRARAVVCSHSKVDEPDAPANMEGPSGSTTKETFHQLNPDRSNFPNNPAQIERMSNEIKTLKRDNERISMEKMSKEGEIKNLRRMLDDTKIKLAFEDQKRVELVDKKSKEMFEKEKYLEKEIESLNTQLQFKDQDIDELQRQVKKMEKVSSGTHEMAKQTSPLRPVDSVPDSASKASLNGGFGPSKKVFFSPIDVRPPLMSPKTTEGMCGDKGKGGLSEAQFFPFGKKTKLACLNTFDRKDGISHGSVVVSKLMPSVCTPEAENHHMIGLNQAFSYQQDTSGTHMDAINTKFDLNKIRKWIYHSPARDVEPSKQIAPEYQYDLATHAVLELLDEKVEKNEVVVLEPAVLILPVLDSYLSLYTDMFHTGFDRGSGSSMASSVPTYSSSLETYSLDSLTNRLKLIKNDFSASAYMIERFALNSISLLHVLAENCDKVRDILLEEKNVSCSSQYVQYLESNSNVCNAGGNRNPFGSRQGGSNCVHHAVKDIQTFTTLIQLSNPAYPNVQRSSFYIIESCLRTLLLLAERCHREQINKFEALLRQDILFNLLVEDLPWSTEQKCRCQNLVLKLITAMARSPETLLKLHTESEECLLHAACSFILSQNHVDLEQNYQLGLKVIQLIVTIISSHPGGLSALFKTDCLCNGDVTKAVIHLLSVGLHKYRASPAHDILPHLRQGVSLLNQLAVKDNFFKKYKNQLQHQYVEVIIGVDALFKESRDLDVYLEEAIQNLWDFDQEYPGVQETCIGSDEAMDTQ